MKSDKKNVKITFKNNFFLKCLQNKKERHKLSQLLFNNNINSTFNDRIAKSSANININNNDFKFNINKKISKDNLQKMENKGRNYEVISSMEKSEKNNYDWNMLLNSPKLGDIDIKKKIKLTDINENKIKRNQSYKKRVMTDINSDKKIISSHYIDNKKNNKLKNIAEKLSILKAKVTTSTKKLRNELIKQRIKSSKEEKKLYEILNKDNLILSKQDLIIAGGERKNAGPLLKNILHQQNPHLETAKENNKLYYKTMKPFGNNYGNIDYSQNDRWKSSAEIKNLREKEQKQYSNVGTSMDENDLINNDHNEINNTKLVLSYYDANDPDIKYFNCLLNKYNKRCISFKNGKNMDYFNSFNSFNNDDKVKEKIYLSNIQSPKRGSSIKSKMKNKEFSKFPFIVEHIKTNTKSTERKNKLYNDRKFFNN
jgi:hypothetical protein